MKKKLISGLIAMLLMCTVFVPTTMAATAYKGIITADRVNMRAEPTVASKRVDKLNNKTSVVVIGSKGDWYHIQYNGKEGWVNDDFMVKLNVKATPSNTTTTTTQETSDAPKSVSFMTIGDRGDDVKTLQSALKYLGYLDGSVDGVFGEITLKAVEKYQDVNDLEVDGKAGKITKSAVYGEQQKIEDIIDYAKSFLGVKYVYGAADPAVGFDCSGLTSYVYKKFGIDLDRSSRAQSTNGAKVSPNQLRPGDLVFFYEPVGHVGIYIGNGEFLQAPQTGDVVKISKLKSYNCARRVVGKVFD